MKILPENQVKYNLQYKTGDIQSTAFFLQ